MDEDGHAARLRRPGAAGRAGTASSRGPETRRWRQLNQSLDGLPEDIAALEGCATPANRDQVLNRLDQIAVELALMDVRLGELQAEQRQVDRPPDGASRAGPRAPPGRASPGGGPRGRPVSPGARAGCPLKYLSAPGLSGLKIGRHNRPKYHQPLLPNEPLPEPLFCWSKPSTWAASSSLPSGTTRWSPRLRAGGAGRLPPPGLRPGHRRPVARHAPGRHWR